MSYQNLQENLIKSNRQDDSGNFMTIEEALKEAGDSNCYQNRMFIFLALQWIFFGMFIMSQALIFNSPDYICSHVSDPSQTFSCTPNSYYCDSSSFIIQPAANSPETLIVTFGLYCDKAYLKSMTQSLFFASGSISTLIIAYICDKYGRRLGLFLCYFIGAVPLLAGSICQNYILFAVCYVIAGAGLNPFISFSFIIVSESGNENYRKMATTLILYAWTFGEMGAGLIVWLLDDNWRNLCLYCIGIPLTAMSVFYLWIYESPKFLVSKGYFSLGKKIIKDISLVNKRKISDFEFSEAMKVSGIKNNNNETKKQHYGYIDLFRFASLRNVTIGGSIMYFSTQYVYYGSIFGINSLGGNIYLNCFLLGLSEFLGYLLSVPIVKYLKRRVAFVSAFFLSGIASLSFLIITIPSNCQASNQNCFLKDVEIIFAMITRLMISIAFLIIYLYLNELYPVPVRSIGTGLCTFMGRVGSILAPTLVSILTNAGWNPWISFGIFAAVAAIASYQMKETFGQPLKNEIEELEEENQILTANINPVPEQTKRICIFTQTYIILSENS